ncbi:MAG: hypothetical protein QM757_45130 [Paludibaculum sp.]
MGQRPDRLSDTSPNGFHTRDKGRGNRAHSGDQYAEFSLGGRDLDTFINDKQSTLLVESVDKKRIYPLLPQEQPDVFAPDQPARDVLFLTASLLLAFLLECGLPDISEAISQRDFSFLWRHSEPTGLIAGALSVPG